MCFLGVLKRIVPFFLAFAAGLFIASFFVNIASPSFSFPRRSYKFREMNRLRDENRELRRANEDLRRQLDEERSTRTRYAYDAPDFNFEVPPPPPPPRIVMPVHQR